MSKYHNGFMHRQDDCFRRMIMVYCTSLGFMAVFQGLSPITISLRVYRVRRNDRSNYQVALGEEEKEDEKELILYFSGV